MLHTGGAGAAAATLQNHYAWLQAITISNRLLAGRLFQMGVCFKWLPGRSVACVIPFVATTAPLLPWHLACTCQACDLFWHPANQSVNVVVVNPNSCCLQQPNLVNLLQVYV
jgi:hypothetical protein